MNDPAPHFREKEPPTGASTPTGRPGVRRSPLFWGAMSAFGFLYLFLVVAMVVADLQFASLQDIRDALTDARVRFSFLLSLSSCTISAILSTWVAVPTGYLLARTDDQQLKRRLERRPRLCRAAIILRHCIETLFDIPVVLPPLVVGLSLLVLFMLPPLEWIQEYVVYQVPAVIIAQFSVACAFVRNMIASA